MLVANSERRSRLLALLREAEYQVQAVSDTESAADSLREASFDTLVLDLDAPNVDLVALRQALSKADSVQPESLEVAERRHLAITLQFTAGNKRKAAHLLGISRSTLLNKVRKYGLLMLAGLTISAARVAVAQSGPIPPGRVISGALSFDGHATVGDFVGRTTSVSGEIAEAADLAAVRGWVQAPVNTLTTGNGKRDKDLNKSMESSKYPELRFELVGITPKGGTQDSTVVTLHGKLMIHGVTRTVALPGVVQFTGSEARVRSDFPLNLKDYRIGGLSKMLGVLKMYDDIEVHVDVLFGLAPGVAAPRS